MPPSPKNPLRPSRSLRETQSPKILIRTRQPTSLWHIDKMSLQELRQLPSTEKIKIIEALWDDLLATEDDIPVPSWHEAELRKTEADYQSGRINSIAWEDAKKSLRDRFE